MTEKVSVSVGASRCLMSHEAPTDAVVGRLCDHHYAAVREQLQDCMEMYAILPEFLLPGSTAHESDESKYTKKSTIPAPIRLDVLALTDPRNATDLEWSHASNWDQSKGRLTGNGADIPTFWYWLDGWAEYVREDVHSDDQPDRTVSGNTKWLQAHLNWLSADELLPVFLTELRRAHGALMTGVGRSPKKPLGKCYLDFDNQECKGSIWLSDDSKGARCGRCKATWTGKELIRLRIGLEQTA